jgi:hypothetical protein
VVPSLQCFRRQTTTEDDLTGHRGSFRLDPELLDEGHHFSASAFTSASTNSGSVVRLGNLDPEIREPGLHRWVGQCLDGGPIEPADDLGEGQGISQSLDQHRRTFFPFRPLSQFATLADMSGRSGHICETLLTLVPGQGASSRRSCRIGFCLWPIIRLVFRCRTSTEQGASIARTLRRTSALQGRG